MAAVNVLIQIQDIMEIKYPTTKFEDLVSYNDKLKKIIYICKNQNWMKDSQLEFEAYAQMKKVLARNYETKLNPNDLYGLFDLVELERFLLKGKFFEKNELENELQKRLETAKQIISEGNDFLGYGCWLTDDKGKINCSVFCNSKLKSLPSKNLECFI